MIKKWIIAGSLCATVLCAGLGSPIAFAASPSVNDVEAAINRGDLQGAQKMLDQVVAEHPGSARAHYLDAQVLERNHRYADALAQLNAAKSADPAIGFTDRNRFDAVQRRIEREVNGSAVNNTSGGMMQSQGGQGRFVSAAPAHHGPSPIAWIGLLIVIAAVVGLIMWGMRRRREGDDVGSTDVRRAQLKQASEMLDAVRATKLDLKLSTSSNKQAWINDAEDIEAQLRTMIDRLTNANTPAANSPQADPAYQLEALQPRIERLKALAAGRPDPAQAPVENRSAYADEANRLSGNSPYGFGQQPAQPGAPGWGPGQPGGNNQQVIIQQPPAAGGSGFGGLAAGVLLGEMLGGHRDREVIVDDHDSDSRHAAPQPPNDVDRSASGNDAFDFGNGNDSWNNDSSQIDAGNDDSDSSWDDNNT